MTALAELVALLEERIGLDAESIGTPAIERAVWQRVAACRLADDRAYWDHVRSSETELQELIESIVVPETWFFRDREALAAVGRLAVEARRRRPDVILHLLSLPCSTGEEPYSMAMALLDAGVGAESFRIDAVDISAQSLAIARRAIYGRNSFRGGNLDFRGRYFEAGPDGHRLNARVQQCVQFRQGNLLSLDLPRPSGGYDFILCRNVLIYFAAPAQRRALRTLDDLLAPGGLICVGPAEAGLMIRHGHASAQIPLAFAFRRDEGTREGRTPASASRAAAVTPVPHMVRSLHRPAPRRPLAPPAAPSASRGGLEEESAPQPSTVADIERLANEGRLDEAAAACEGLLRAGEAGAKVYYLAGVIQGALGHRARAIEFYRKAVYLDPAHADALAHLAYLLDAAGDKARADVFRDRARRAREQSDS